MKIRTEPLLGAAMFAILLTLAASLISAFVIRGPMQSVLEMPLTDPNFDPTNTDLEAIFNDLMVTSSITSLVSCLLWLVGGLGAGIIYTILHNRQAPLSGGAPRGGAAAGALGFFISTLIGGMVQMVFTNSIMMDMMQGMAGTSGAPLPEWFGATMLGISIFAALCGGLFMALIGAMVGALGGLMGGAFVKGKTAA